MEKVIFYAVLNIFGLNFSHKVFSKNFIIFIRTFLCIYGLFCNVQYFREYHNFSEIFFYADVYQLFIPWLLELTFVIRSVYYDVNDQQVKINIVSFQKFILRLFVAISMRIPKILKGKLLSEKLQSFGFGLSEFTISFNDYLFASYVESLCCELKASKSHKSVLKILKLKRSLQRRYSFELMCTISYNFGSMILNFYWVVVRVTYRLLTKPKGNFIKF
jgi:hypothetical protein